MSEKKQLKKQEENEGIGNNKISVETAKKIQDLQLLEQNLQGIVMQKQNFQLELNEVLNALNELQTAKGEAYKITGSIMVQADKNSLEKDLKTKEESLNLRIKNLEKQENILREKLLKIRDDVMKELK